MFSFLDELTPLKALALISGALAMIAVWALNAAFTFTYGAEVIGPFLLEAQLGVEGSALLSGAVAVLFYDLSYTVGFLVLLAACRSVWQYAITGLQFFACFMLSILASITSIILLSPLGGEVPPELLTATRYLGYGGLIVGFVVNALATVFYIATGPEMFARITQSVHEASQTADTEKFNKQLRKQARTLAHDLVRDDLSQLAAQEAAAIRANYIAGLPERTSGRSDGRPALPAPNSNGRPAPTRRHEADAPAGPEVDNLDIYRQAPGDKAMLLAEEFSSQDEALAYIHDHDLAGSPSGTRYRIDSYGRTVGTYEKTDDDTVNPRPTRPRYFE